MILGHPLTTGLRASSAGLALELPRWSLYHVNRNLWSAASTVTRDLDEVVISCASHSSASREGERSCVEAPAAPIRPKQQSDE